MVTKEYLSEFLICLPDGWVKRFGEQMIDEIYNVVHKAELEYEDFEYYVLQVKEKYGTLRWYDAGFPDKYYDELQEIIDRYEVLSSETCAVCGEEGRMSREGWHMPYCDKHRNK